MRCSPLADLGPKTPSGVVSTQRWIARVVIGPITPSTASLPETALVARVVERDTIVARAGDGAAVGAAAPAFARVSPARAPQVGQAPGPCVARTRCAVAIWADLLARWALDAKLVPPNAFHVEAENCSPPE